MSSIVRILLAIVFACLTAGLVHDLYIAGTLGTGLSLQRIVDMALTCAGYAAPFLAIGILAGEWLRLRNGLVYLIGGMATALAAGLLYREWGVPDIASWFRVPPFSMLLTMGALGGLVYWFLQGYRAGWQGDQVERGLATGQEALAKTFASERRPRCWPCLLAGALLAALPLLALGLWQISKPDLASSIRAKTEAEAKQALATAGYPWATLRIDGYRGYIEGTAPDDAQRENAFAAAQSYLAPAIGMPGVVGTLENDIVLTPPPPGRPTIATVSGATPASPRGDTAAETKRKADLAAADAKRKSDEDARLRAVAEAKRVADAAAVEAKRKADEDAKRVADTAAAEVKRKADEDAKRVADATAAEAKRKADEDAKRVADAAAAEAKRKADEDAKRVADAAAAEAKRKADDDAKRVADAAAAEAKRKADEDAKRAADAAAAEAKRKADEDAKRVADAAAAEAKRKADEDAKRAADTAAAEAKRVAEAAAVEAKRIADAAAATARTTVVERTPAPPAIPAIPSLPTLPPTPSTPPALTAPAAPAATTTTTTAAACDTDAVARLEATRVTFDTASSDLGAPDRTAIAVIVDSLKRCSTIKIVVNGHADGIGADGYNIWLGQRRAEAIRTELASAGIAADRLTVRSFGGAQPLLSNDTEEGRAVNRRVEFTMQGALDATAPAFATRAAACKADLARMLTASGGIVFEPSSAVIAAESAARLDELATAAKACAPFGLLVEGHADKTGNPNWNIRISDVRASAVRDALVARGVPATRVGSKGFGSSRLLDPADTKEAHARNRRIEISVGSTASASR